MGSWWDLVGIINEGADLDQKAATRVPVECPNDYTTLKSAGEGKLFCPWDGWVWPDDA